jgi:hypothetical protein
MAKGTTHVDLAKYGSGGDQALVTSRDMYIDFYHIATGYCVKFKAFLNNIQDQFNSSWNSQQVYGRMDPIMNFQNTQRTVSLSFSVPAVNLEEAIHNLHSIEHLVSQLYPSYQGQVIAGSPLMKIKFANLIKSARSGHSAPDAMKGGLVAAVDGITFAPDMDAGFFIPHAGQVYPKSFNVDMSFTVLHTHPLGYRKGGKWRSNKYSFPYVTDPAGAMGESSNCRKGGRKGVGKPSPSNESIPKKTRRKRSGEMLGGKK